MIAKAAIRSKKSNQILPRYRLRPALSRQKAGI
jgi:hypothetical protein